jgi:ATP-dependent Clp protease ATP-binding subunit ClpA
MPLELINRFDEIIFFNDFTEENMKKIIKKELSKFASINNTKIKYHASLVNFVYKKNKNKEFGARQLKRIIQNEVLDLLSSFLLNNEAQSSVVMSFSAKSNKVVIK